MRKRLAILMSMCVVFGGASVLSAEEETDEGLCVWNMTWTGSCITGDPVAECETRVFDECKNTHWKVSLATCTGGAANLTCTAKWEES